MRTHPIRAFVTLLSVAAVAIGVTTVDVPTAAAADATVGATMTICAQSLYLRTEPSGPMIDTLPNASHFKVDDISPSGEWVYGYSYYDQQHGWVQNGWFC